VSARAVLDASALLAWLQDEPGAQLVDTALAAGAAMSAVNWAEVLSKAAEAGQDPDALAARLTDEGLLGGLVEVLPLEAADAPLIARLRPLTRSAGLSLADRACLALAQRLGLEAVTAERAWAGLELGVSVRVIRGVDSAP
jgi:PIN domain nuclease of toxin-antitoxin system